MHELAGLLDGPRARGVFLIRGCFRPPWAVRVQDRAPLSVMVQMDGEAVLRPADDGEATHVRPGDVAFARGPDPYVVGDRAETTPRVEIGEDFTCRSVRPEADDDYVELDGRGWGNRGDGPTTMLIGTYGITGPPDCGGRAGPSFPPIAGCYRLCRRGSSSAGRSGRPRSCRCSPPSSSRRRPDRTSCWTGCWTFWW